jgi:hypothetical protein
VLFGVGDGVADDAEHVHLDNSRRLLGHAPGRRDIDLEDARVRDHGI